jgi:hypothetical protein
MCVSRAIVCSAGTLSDPLVIGNRPNAAAVAPIGVNAAGTAPADRVQGSFLGAAVMASAMQARCN